MSYTFLRCQPHKKCPDLTGWYLELRPDDTDALMKLHKGVAGLYYYKFGMDPHLKPDSEEGVLMNPIRLAAGWLQTIERYLLRGEAVLINCNGGMMPREGAIVLDQMESEAMEWPEQWPDEVITISRWPRGHHYYLSSNKNRVFVPSKYVKYDDAVEAARRYTPNVRSKC